jgi:hypothetical protein
MSTLNSPPQFNDENYAYWKVRMRVFLKSLDEKVWHLVKQRWIKPETPFTKWNKDNVVNCNGITKA